MCPETVLPKHCTYNSLLGSNKRIKVLTVTMSPLKFPGKGLSLTFQQGSSGDTAQWKNTVGQGFNPRTQHSNEVFLSDQQNHVCFLKLPLIVCILQLQLKSRPVSTERTKSSLSSSLIYHFTSILLRVSTHCQLESPCVAVNCSPFLMFQLNTNY